MNRYQTSDNETIAVREQKQRERLCKKLLDHISRSGLFTNTCLIRVRIEEDCYINAFSENVTEYVRFQATLEV